MTTTVELRSRNLPALAGALLLFVLLVALKFSSLESMWHVWGDSNTYTHGYLVFPMVAYLIYINRHVFAHAVQEPMPGVALGVLACGMVWVFSSLMNVHVVGQLMFVASGILLCLGFYGVKKTATIMFPLAYLFFAVPMGEGLVPKLMEFTADFTVWALKLTGLPVFRDGMYFSIPAGDFEVAKACSGIRYLMASFALGTLYAYLSYRSFRKQLVFSLLSLLVPIIANGLRAYGIVMIAHFSDMKYAVGVDHLVYGWLFFGLVMFFLFFIGGKFRSEEDMYVPDSTPVATDQSVSGSKLWVVVGVLTAALVLPHAVGAFARQTNSAEVLTATLPPAAANWQGPADVKPRFAPNFSAAVSTAAGLYRYRGAEVYVWVHRYPAFDSNHEMITETNRLADLDRWAVFQQRARSVEGTEEISVIETQLGDRREEYTVWHWYQLNDTVANGRVRAKLAEGTALLTGALRVDQALVTLATPARGESAIELLERFIADHHDELLGCATRPGARCVVAGAQ